MSEQQKKPKSMGVLTIQKIIGVGGFLGTTKGQELAARFCEAVDSGKTPDQADLKAVADALRVVLEYRSHPHDDVLAVVGNFLGITTRQGQGRTAQLSKNRKVQEVCEYLEDFRARVKSGVPQKQAEIEARKAMTQRLNVGDRACRNKIKQFGKEAEQLLEAMSR